MRLLFKDLHDYFCLIIISLRHVALKIEGIFIYKYYYINKIAIFIILVAQINIFSFIDDDKNERMNFRVIDFTINYIKF